MVQGLYSGRLSWLLAGSCNDRESQSSSLRTGVHFRLNQANFMVLQVSTVWPIDSLWQRTYVKVMPFNILIPGLIS